MSEWVYEKDNLPTGWARTSMENVSVNDKYAIRMGPFGSQLKKHELVDSGIRVLWIENIVNNKFENKKEKFITNKKYETLKGFSVKPNDVLITMMGTIGRTCVVPSDIGKTIISSHLLKITPHIDLIDPIFLTYLVRGEPQILKQIKSKSRGVIMKGLNTKIIKSLEFSLPPLNEQKRIVSKIESIFAQIDAIKKSLDKNKVLLIQYKQSILKSSFENKPTKKLIFKTAKELFYIKGRIGWRGLKKSDFTKSGPYLITGVDFYKGKINWENCYRVPLEKYVESPEIIVQRNDILLTKDGTIGKIAYIDKVPVEKATLNAHLLLIRNLKNNQVFPKYIFYLLHSPYFHFYVGQNKTGVTRPSLSQRLFEQFIVPLPSLNDQEQIVYKIESIFGNIDTLNLFCFILRENLFTNLRYFMILYIQHVISEQ